ncbi:tRNA pseudouridine(38-40) synthase TruA [Acholeplasma hippikon]|uniref:tRNA pseudouridine synthase A n=1 Tax=Acholeplasma hippikon TaxID=264636 RepID=A0A449BKN0_9MOLU|nr:tRNA pseudouridine(38-40) synthase TruA [Acholeplasma hippikon]VEU82943.1 tRNA pseudouridine synthase A [Acholeplasma hippikon]
MRYKAVVSYDGTNYSGYQKQINDVSIQGAIEKAFRLMTQIDIPTFASSRTDKGVHALYQVLHFDADMDIPQERWVEGLNKRLPGDIRIKSVKKVNDDFHARHSSKSKTYIYKVAKKPSSAFTCNYEVYERGFDINLVKEDMKAIVGTHDFTAFSPNKEGKPPVKTIYSFDYKETKTHYIFKIHGNSFLRYMVRSIMGNILAIGTGKKPVGHIKTLLETKERTLTAKTAPACGLYLYHIYYK